MARVAPEKAAFRPALPSCFKPGIAEMQMTKKSYFEKLKDPRWQKKRLERLEKSGWACDSCGDAETTLHVHHKAYFKGREPWEYEAEQLASLCDSCHSAEHSDEDALQLEASYVGIESPFSRESTASLIAGYNMRPLTHTPDPEAYFYGELVSFWPKHCGPKTRGLTETELIKLIEAVQRDPSGFIDAIRAFAVLPYAPPKETGL